MTESKSMSRDIYENLLQGALWHQGKMDLISRDRVVVISLTVVNPISITFFTIKAIDGFEIVIFRIKTVKNDIDDS